MNKHSKIKIGLLGALLALSLVVMAEPSYNKRILWTQKPNTMTGLYTTPSDFIQDGFSIGGSIVYSSGDHDIGNGVPIFSGFSIDALSASLNAAYHQPLSAHFGMRYTLSLGALRGKNKDRDREFLSLFAEPAVGVECYPMQHYGLMLYAGVALPLGYLAKYKYGTAKNPNFVLAPAVQLGIGYTWLIDTKWMVTVDLTGTYALMEIDGNPRFGLDGIGKKKTFTDHDGYFKLGVAFTYRFGSDCQACKILNNYSRSNTYKKRRR